MAKFDDKIYLLADGLRVKDILKDYATSVEGLIGIVQCHFYDAHENALDIEVDLPNERVYVTVNGRLFAELIIHILYRNYDDKGYLDAE